MPEAPLKTSVDAQGITWWSQGDLLHRPDGPAVEYPPKERKRGRGKWGWYYRGKQLVNACGPKLQAPAQRAFWEHQGKSISLNQAMDLAGSLQLALSVHRLCMHKALWELEDEEAPEGQRRAILHRLEMLTEQLEAVRHP